MRKFVKSVSIILSALLIFQFMISDIGFAQKVNKKDTVGNKILSESGTKAKVKILPKGNTRVLVAERAAAEPIIPMPSDIAADTTSPTIPQNLSYKAVSQNSIELNWSPSTDDSGIVSYAIFRDESMIATVTSSAIYIDSDLQYNI